MAGTSSATPVRTRTDRAGRRYELVRELGSGGFGAVWLARMHNPGGLTQAVALKLLRHESTAANQAIERLLDEALVLSNLRHPVIVAAFDLARFDDEVALVTEYVEGLDLTSCVFDAETPMPPSAMLEVASQVASALHDAWVRLRIVHRDVKPANIRIGRHGTVKLLDFGIARSALPRSAHTGTDLLVGSLSYLAPERFRQREPNPASDVFALGCVLYEGLTGARLFGTLPTPEVIGLLHDGPGLDAHVEQRIAEPPSPSAAGHSTVLVRSPFPVSIRQLLREMLAFAPEARPTPAEVVQRCERAQDAAPNRVTLRAYCRSLPWPDDALASIASTSIGASTFDSVGASATMDALAAPNPPTAAASATASARPTAPLRQGAGWAWLGATVATLGGGAAALGAVAVVAAAVVVAAVVVAAVTVGDQLTEPIVAPVAPIAAPASGSPEPPAAQPSAQPVEAPPVREPPRGIPAPAPTAARAADADADAADAIAVPDAGAVPGAVPDAGAGLDGEVSLPPEPDVAAAAEPDAAPNQPVLAPPPPEVPTTAAVRITLADPGPIGTFAVNCPSGVRLQRPFDGGVVVVEGVPIGERCFGYFVSKTRTAAVVPSIEVIAGADLACQRGLKVTCR